MTFREMEKVILKDGWYIDRQKGEPQTVQASYKERHRNLGASQLG